MGDPKMTTAGVDANEYLSSVFGLSGCVAIVTGASRGIGFALAQALAQAGAMVVGIGRSASATAPLHANFSYRSLDVRDASAFTALCGECKQQYGRLDILVNAAGLSVPVGEHSTDIDTFASLIDVNLHAVYACCMAAAPVIASSGGGSIINVTSIGSVLGFPGNPGYVASKGGLRMLTKALAMDLGAQNVRVNNLAPGYIRTDMTEKSYQNPELHKQRRDHTILGRWGETADLIGATIFLSSNASSYVTGTDIFVDGGWTAQGMTQG